MTSEPTASSAAPLDPPPVARAGDARWLGDPLPYELRDGGERLSTDELAALQRDLLAALSEQLGLPIAQLGAPAAAPELEGLSPRELQVLRLVAQGNTSKDIAVMLDLGLLTVRTYRKTLMKKIGVTNVANLTKIALEAGVTTWGDKKGEKD